MVGRAFGGGGARLPDLAGRRSPPAAAAACFCLDLDSSGGEHGGTVAGAGGRSIPPPVLSLFCARFAIAAMDGRRSCSLLRPPRSGGDVSPSRGSAPPPDFVTRAMNRMAITEQTL